MLLYLSLLLLLIGIVVIVVIVTKHRQTANPLLATGQKLVGTVIDVKTSRNTTINAYKVVVSASNSLGQVKSYESHAVEGTPSFMTSSFLTNPVSVDVYVNPSNPADYYVDTRQLKSTPK